MKNLKKRISSSRVEASIRAYNSALITSNEGIVNHFALMLKSKRIESLPHGHKRIAQDLIDAGVVTFEGKILRER